MKRARNTAVGVAGLLAVVLVIALCVFISSKIPCGFYKFEQSAKVPARCLSHYTK